MNQNAVAEVSRAVELREEFDSTFSRLPTGAPEARETLLAIRIGTSPFAIRLEEILGLHVDKSITPLPGTPPEVLGVAGFRGAIATIFDLHVILGMEVGASMRWIALVAGSPGIGVAFELFEGNLQCTHNEIARATELGRAQSQIVDQTVRSWHGETRPIVNLSVLAEELAT
jgi:chemotaxis signal transduction protein